MINTDTLNIFATLCRFGFAEIFKGELVELGAQSLGAESDELAKFKSDTGLDVNIKAETAEDLYLSMGVESYSAIDISGDNGSHPFNLNRDISVEYGFDKKFDLVTNFGTSEHIFNQHNVFKNIHDICEKDGYMLHAIPMMGHLNHSFFTYQPSLFYYLALENGYRIDYMGVLKNDELLNFYPDYLMSLKEENTAALSHYIVVLMRKVNDIAFREPVQFLERDWGVILDYPAVKPVVQGILNMDADKVAIFGGGRTCAKLLEIFKAASIEVSYIIDDFKSGDIDGVPVVSWDEFLRVQSGADCLVYSSQQTVKDLEVRDGLTIPIKKLFLENS